MYWSINTLFPSPEIGFEDPDRKFRSGYPNALGEKQKALSNRISQSGYPILQGLPMLPSWDGQDSENPNLLDPKVVYLKESGSRLFS